METKKELVSVEKEYLENLLSIIKEQSTRLESLEDSLSDLHGIVCAIGEKLACI